MKQFTKEINMPEGFFYETVLPFLGANGWEYEISERPKLCEVVLLALQNPEGEVQTDPQARRLITNLVRGAVLAPCYVHVYKGGHGLQAAGTWGVEVASIDSVTLLDDGDGMKKATGPVSDPLTARVRVYVERTTIKRAEASKRVQGVRPWLVRFVEVRDYRDVGVWMSHCHNSSEAVTELALYRGEHRGVGAVYVCVYEYVRGDRSGADRGHAD